MTGKKDAKISIVAVVVVVASAVVVVVVAVVDVIMNVYSPIIHRVARRGTDPQRIVAFFHHRRSAIIKLCPRC